MPRQSKPSLSFRGGHPTGFFAIKLTDQHQRGRANRREPARRRRTDRTPPSNQWEIAEEHVGVVGVDRHPFAQVGRIRAEDQRVPLAVLRVGATPVARGDRDTVATGCVQGQARILPGENDRALLFLHWLVSSGLEG